MLNTNAIIEQLESLPFDSRAKIVDTLLRTLNHPDPKIDMTWAKESQRRLDDLRSGNVQGIPADTVFSKARERFTK